MKRKNRLWEVDSLRGFAILCMVAFHLFFDLFYLGKISLSPSSFPLILLARFTAVAFLFLVGFSFSLSSDKYHSDYFLLMRHTLIRAAKVLFAASTITLATYFISSDYTVRFGILHLIAFSLLLLIPLSLLPDRKVFLPLAISIIFAGTLLNLKPTYTTFDFYPIVPWFGVVLLGFSLAKNYSLYRPRLFTRTPPRFISPLITIGRHSLAIYLLHQPILFGLLFLLKG